MAITKRDKILTRDNVKGFLGLCFFGAMVGSIADDSIHGAKAESLCQQYKAELSDTANKVRSAANVSVNGHKPSVEYSITIKGSEYGSFLPWSRKTCNIVEPAYN